MGDSISNCSCETLLECILLSYLLTKDGLLHPISDGSLCNKYHQTHFKRALESKSIFEMREIVHTVAVVTGQSEIKVIAPQPNIRLP